MQANVPVYESHLASSLVYLAGKNEYHIYSLHRRFPLHGLHNVSHKELLRHYDLVRNFLRMASNNHSFTILVQSYTIFWMISLNILFPYLDAFYHLWYVYYK